MARDRDDFQCSCGRTLETWNRSRVPQFRLSPRTACCLDALRAQLTAGVTRQAGLPPEFIFLLTLQSTGRIARPGNRSLLPCCG
jgi:hypothetical protein